MPKPTTQHYYDLAKVYSWIKENEEFRPKLPTVTHNTLFGQDNIAFQYWGWAIVLLPNGKWFWEDTSGG